MFKRTHQHDPSQNQIHGRHPKGQPRTAWPSSINHSTTQLLNFSTTRLQDYSTTRLQDHSSHLPTFVSGRKKTKSKRSQSSPSPLTKTAHTQKKQRPHKTLSILCQVFAPTQAVIELRLHGAHGEDADKRTSPGWVTPFTVFCCSRSGRLRH